MKTITERAKEAAEAFKDEKSYVQTPAIAETLRNVGFGGLAAHSIMLIHRARLALLKRNVTAVLQVNPQHTANEIVRNVGIILRQDAEIIGLQKSTKGNVITWTDGVLKVELNKKRVYGAVVAYTNALLKAYDIDVKLWYRREELIWSDGVSVSEERNFKIQ